MKEMSLLDLQWPDATFRSDTFDRIMWREFRPPDFPDNPAMGWTQLQGELFSRMYGHPPRIPEDDIRPELAHVEAIHNQLSELPEWEQLEQSVKGEAMLAAFATKTLAETASKLLESCNAPSEMDDQNSQLLEATGGDPTGQARKNIQNKAKQAAESIKSDAGRAALRMAASKAQQEATDTRQTAHAIGWGNEPGQPLDKTECDAARKLAARMKNDPRIRAIIMALGKMQGHASKAFTRQSSMSLEVTDICVGRDLPRQIPTELLRMGLPQFRASWLKSYVEGGLLQYELDSPPEKVGRGDALILVDVSGSMSGEPEAAAKAFAAVAAMRMGREKRQAWLGVFDTQLHWFQKATPGVIVGLLEQNFSGGGTDFDQPTLALPEEACKSERADLVYVTDGYCMFQDPKAIARIAKSFGRMLVVLVGGGSASGFTPLEEAGVKVLVADLHGTADDDRFADVFRELLD